MFSPSTRESFFTNIFFVLVNVDYYLVYYFTKSKVYKRIYFCRAIIFRTMWKLPIFVALAAFERNKLSFDCVFKSSRCKSRVSLRMLFSTTWTPTTAEVQTGFRSEKRRGCIFLRIALQDARLDRARREGRSFWSAESRMLARSTRFRHRGSRIDLQSRWPEQSAPKKHRKTSRPIITVAPVLSSHYQRALARCINLIRFSRWSVWIRSGPHKHSSAFAIQYLYKKSIYIF